MKAEARRLLAEYGRKMKEIEGRLKQEDGADPIRKVLTAYFDIQASYSKLMTYYRFIFNALLKFKENLVSEQVVSRQIGNTVDQFSIELDNYEAIAIPFKLGRHRENFAGNMMNIIVQYLHVQATFCREDLHLEGDDHYLVTNRLLEIMTSYSLMTWEVFQEVLRLTFYINSD